jgi:hypothetical protein
MSFQAQQHPGEHPRSALPTTRTPAAIAFAATFSAALLGAMAGCGSGSAGPSQQSLAAPVANAKGPQLGYIWMASDHSLRPVLGVAGSSTVGQSVVPAGTYAASVTSATAGVALLQDTAGAVDLMKLPSGSPASLGVTLPAGASLRLSPSATTALLYSPGAATATLVTALDSSPQIRSVAAAGPILDSAVSDLGTVAFEYAQASETNVSVVDSQGHALSVTSLHAPGGLSFLPGKDDLLAADSAASSLTLIRSASSAPSALVLPTGSSIQSPVAVGVSASGRWALVTNGAASQSAVRIDLTSQTSTLVACSCKATLAEPLADDGAFRLTDAVTGPNWIVDAAPSTPRVLFIPALPVAVPAAKTTVASSTHASRPTVSVGMAQ